MHHATIIAIDGPAASGKSTVGKKLADALGYLFFDSGVMYRAVTLAALQRAVPVTDEAAITALAEQVEIDVRPPSVQDERSSDILLNGMDVTWEIRLPEVDENVSLVSTYPGVRRALTSQQRRVASRGSVVMVGRDIGTVVFPEADLKVYLDASVQQRAQRRYDEIRQRGEPADYQEILSAMRKRDRIDSTRLIAPLRPADDATIIQSDRMAIDEVVSRVLELSLQGCTKTRN
jgi:cytidylate kinase